MDGSIPTAVLNQIPAAIIATDAAEHVILVNAHACMLLGIDEKDAYGRVWRDVVHFDRVGPDPMHSRGNKGQMKNYWAECTRSDGTRINLSVSEQALRGDSSRQHGLIVTFTENSGERHYISRLERAREQAEEAASSKTTFLANMSHELRTPLNSIFGMSSLALDLAQSKDQREYLTILKASAESLFQLISSLLDYIKLENGKVSLNHRNFRLLDFLEDTLSPAALQCHEKGLGLHVITDPSIEFSVIGDETRLRQVILNLLSNAVKFTDQGEIVLKVSELPPPEDSKDKIHIEWTLKDSGIGISAENLLKIFDPFVQVDGSATRNAGGTGIGLSITRHLVELMGGTITVRSRPGQGSTFVFTTLFERGPRTTHNGPEPGFLEGLEIALVSASESWCDAVRPWLQWAGARLHTCPDLATLKGVLEVSSQVPLCLFHGMYPDTEGVVGVSASPVLQRLKERTHLVTFRLQRLEERLWQTAGFMYETLMEPIRPSRLLSIIQYVQAEQKSGKDRSAAIAYRSSRPLSILYVEDDYLTASVHMQLMEEAGHHVTLAENGLKALETLRSAQIDMVILDIEMPEMDGYELASSIRGGDLGPEKSRIPLIALTAHSSASDVKHAEVLGIDAFMAKPFFPQSLLFTIDRIRDKGHVSTSVKPVPPDMDESIKVSGLQRGHLEEISSLLAEGQRAEAEHLMLVAREWSLAHERSTLASGLLKALFKIRRGEYDAAEALLAVLRQTIDNVETGGNV